MRPILFRDEVIEGGGRVIEYGTAFDNLAEYVAIQNSGVFDLITAWCEENFPSVVKTVSKLDGCIVVIYPTDEAASLIRLRFG